MTAADKINAKLDEMKYRANSKYGRLALQDEYGQWLLHDFCAVENALGIAVEALKSIRSGDRSDAVNRECDEATEDIAEALEGKP